jgi:hypothetical protein
VTSTAWLADGVADGVMAVPVAGAESMKTNALPELPPWSTVTTSVTDRPGWSVPCWLLSVTCGDCVFAHQLTGPPSAVSVSWPIEPSPRVRLSGVTVRLPAGLGIAEEADEEARVSGRPGWPGWPGWPGRDGDEAPGRDAATASDTVLLAADGWKGSVADDVPAGRLTVTGTTASAPPPG